MFKVKEALPHDYVLAYDEDTSEWYFGREVWGRQPIEVEWREQAFRSRVDAIVGVDLEMKLTRDLLH